VRICSPVLTGDLAGNQSHWPLMESNHPLLRAEPFTAELSVHSTSSRSGSTADILFPPCGILPCDPSRFASCSASCRPVPSGPSLSESFATHPCGGVLPTCPTSSQTDRRCS